MIPITRKDHYLNEIVGWGDTAPEKPYIEEEFFFAEILGEAVQAPEPLPRYQMYLAKIAGRNIDIPYPKTRLEYFLAKAAGMDITVPVPITREEIFWSNYSAIVDFEVEGVPPLTYKAIEGTLENYSIYGNTVGGESVGDLVESGEHAGEYRVPVTVEGKNLFDINNLEDRYDISSETGLPVQNSPYSYLRCAITTPINVSAGDYYLTFNKNIVGEIGFIVSVFENNIFISRASEYYSGARIRIFSGNNIYICFYNSNPTAAIHPSDISNIMLNEGSTALPYEPYHAPVTTPIYLPEQIRKVGDEVEYVDYQEQKQHRVRKNLLQNTATSQTINGVTFTVNNDGGVTCNGTVSEETPIGENALFIVPTITLPAGKYILSGCPAGGSEKTTFKQLIYANRVWLGNDKGSGANFILTDAGKVSVRIAIYPGYTCNNLTFYPMIRKADIEDDTYEPYIENTDLNVTLPALPTLTGTNTLSVGTAVQPSKVYIKGEKER